jgi:hypothetical protein
MSLVKYGLILSLRATWGDEGGREHGSRLIGANLSFKNKVNISSSVGENRSFLFHSNERPMII